ncbi:hypothetical protein SOPP22_07325 [Shewanella sp. OPT22]|nr:hypothetical protein SOPP22_07325 [Shewanella sp. OPT22]
MTVLHHLKKRFIHPFDNIKYGELLDCLKKLENKSSSDIEQKIINFMTPSVILTSDETTTE